MRLNDEPRESPVNESPVKKLARCIWCGDDPLYQQYHDQEWGVPCREDKKLFEFLCLEGAQSGLSWITILRKREAYRLAFADFEVKKVAAFTDKMCSGVCRTPVLCAIVSRSRAPFQMRVYLSTCKKSLVALVIICGLM